VELTTRCHSPRLDTSQTIPKLVLGGVQVVERVGEMLDFLVQLLLNLGQLLGC
jgi:hypothetical protein